jgi:hypothetical protein
VHLEPAHEAHAGLYLKRKSEEVLSSGLRDGSQKNGPNSAKRPNQEGTVKQTKKQKLALDAQTIRSLNAPQLGEAAGGTWPTKINSQCGKETADCTTLCGG